MSELCRLSSRSDPTDIATEIDNFNSRLERIRVVVQALPRHNFDLLRRVVEHLDR